MIGEVFLLLVKQLNAYLNSRTGWSPEQAAEVRVTLPDGELMDPIRFKLGAVTALLINLEEETTLRGADAYRRTQGDGASVRVQPEIRMALYVLFVARFKQYDEGLRYLSLIIQYFQGHRLLDHQNAPDLSPKIDKLVCELVTLPFSEQNEVWNALRTTYHPSVLYKVNLVVFRDDEEEVVPEVTETVLEATP